MKQLRMYLLVISAIAAVGFFGCAGSETGGEADAGGDAGVADAGSEVAVRECPDGLVFWPEYDVCAPRVDECEAWEVPVIGGGCMAVGPRACPKLWDPDADVDCEPGELMEYEGGACPEGFVLTEDEVACIPFFEEDGVCGELEIPVLGGGCQRVGPEWGEAGEPYFDECPPGYLALEGGGCVQVGPRACPKLWDHDADVDCEVGDVLPCPEGWIESEDGMYCHPGYDECGHGERPLVGGGCQRVIPLPEDCPAGPFPEVPDGAADVLYVLADSLCIEDCGAQAAPYPSIQAAVDVAPSGAAVLVGPGTYAEGLTLTKPVHVIGLCAAFIEVTGKALVLPDGDSKVLEAGVGIFDVQGVTLSGLRVRSPAAGVAIVGATDVVLEGLDIGESHGVALYVDGGSSVDADDLWIHDTEPGSGVMGHGRGFWVGGGANLNAQSVLVEEVRRTGIEVLGEGTRLNCTDCVIRNTNSDSSGKRGWGIYAFEGCTVSVAGSLLDENRVLGLAVSDSGTSVEVSGSMIRKTLSNDHGEVGWGIVAKDGCTLLVAGSLLDENIDLGLVVFDSGTKVEVSGSVIRKTLSDDNGEGGWGIQASEGCTVLVAGSLLEENREVGLAVSDSGTEVEVSGSVIRKTLSNDNGEFGRGIQASEGCTVLVTGSLLEENRDVGLAVYLFGTEVEVFGSVIRKTLPNDNEVGGNGIHASKGCAVSVTGSLLDENRDVGLAVFDSGTLVKIFGSVIRETLSNENGEFGRGIQAIDGCTVSVAGSLLEENRDAGLGVLDSGTLVEVSDSVIRKTLPNDNGVGGEGIQASDGCTVSVTGSLVEENRGVSLAVAHFGTLVEVSGSVIRKTLPNDNGMGGYGILAFDGCTVSVAGSLLEENREGGLAVYHSGTEVEVSGSVIRKTLPNDNGVGGMGIQAFYGCTVSVAGSLLEENMVIGLVVPHSGTEVEVFGSVIRKTLPNDNGRGGGGILATEGSTVLVAGSLLEENMATGLALADSGTEVEVSGSVIRKTLPNNDGFFGQGLVVADGGSATASWCLIDGNSTAGVTVFGRSGDDYSLLHLVNAAVLNTKKGGAEIPGGGYEVFGDGVFAGGGAELRLDSVVVKDNARASVYYNESTGGMSNTVIAGNGSYGLAMESCHQYVDYSDTFIFGNVMGDVTKSPHGLPVPPLPEFMEAFGTPRDFDE